MATLADIYKNPQWLQDWNKYFQDVSPGTTNTFGDITLTKGQGGNATLMANTNIDPSTGIPQILSINQDTDPNRIAQWAPSLAQSWLSTYGNETPATQLTGTHIPWTTQSGAGFGGTNTDTNNFNIPFDVYPQSSSWGNTGSMSGINWNDPVSKGILNQLLSSAQGLPDLAKQLPGTLQDMYSNLMRSALKPSAFQGVINDLASRGLLNSTIAKDTLATTAKDIAQNIGETGYQSLLQGLNAQMNVPSVLAEIAKLGQQTSSFGNQGSSNIDPLAPYQLYANLLTY
jgi:hypothetical protein